MKSEWPAPVLPSPAAARGPIDARRVRVSPRLELRDTGRYGLGVFAREDIAPGEGLYDETGVARRYYSRDEILAHPESQVLRTFSYVVGADTYFTGPRHVVEQDITMFMNHACDPNAWLDTDARMCARRGIGRGEEVTCDYATFETEISFHRGLACLCGSPACRRRLTGVEYCSPGFRRTYAGRLSSHVEHLVRGLRGVREG